jgi:excisionase family DNA binding protein
MNDEQLVFTPEQIAQKIAQGRTTVYALMKSGALPSVRIGRSRRVTKAALEDYVARLESNEAAS